MILIIFIIIIYLAITKNNTCILYIGIISAFIMLYNNETSKKYSNDILEKIIVGMGIKQEKPKEHKKIYEKIFNNIKDNNVENEIPNRILSNPLYGSYEQLNNQKNILDNEYSENNYKYNLFDSIGSLGDNNIAHHMKHISNKNRVAIDNRARVNKYTNMKYFINELDDHANSVWWDDETLEDKF